MTDPGERERFHREVNRYLSLMLIILLGMVAVLLVVVFVQYVIGYFEYQDKVDRCNAEVVHATSIYDVSYECFTFMMTKGGNH